ncbi:MAG: metabolite traffic protein EboE [Planctomycetaceae bacterium]
MTFSTLPLSYCTNVHPGRTLAEVLDGLNQYTATAHRMLERPMAAGLWLASSVVSELLEDPSRLDVLGQTLWQHDLVCYSLNAFPFGDFHDDRVKEMVYLPDWSERLRVDYTQGCARVLSQLLPEGGEGSISTVPLGGTMFPTEPDFHAACLSNLIQVARFLHDLHQETGRLIRLAVEPEPLCHISSIPQDAVPLFAMLFELAEVKGQLEMVREHIGLCFDVCHQAVEFEHIPRSIDQLVDAGVRINKVHITNAVELTDPAGNVAGREALLRYVEQRYLHQTYARLHDARIVTRPDLLADDINRSPPDEFLSAEAWRIHFHVPVFAETLGPLKTTRSDLKAALRRIAALEYSPHLEVETYTWPVMPGEAKSDDLASRIGRELASTYELLESIAGLA